MVSAGVPDPVARRTPWLRNILPRCHRLAFFDHRVGGRTQGASGLSTGARHLHRVGRHNPGSSSCQGISAGPPPSASAAAKSQAEQPASTEDNPAGQDAHNPGQKDQHANGSGNGSGNGDPQRLRGSADTPNAVLPSQNGNNYSDNLEDAGPNIPAASSTSSSSSSSSDMEIQGTSLDPSAYEVTWDFVTFRGCRDGSVVYKFGGPDPVARLLMGPPPRFEEPEGVTWSNALRLWVKKGTSVELSLCKLEQYIQDYLERQSSEQALNHQLYREYDDILARMEERLSEARQAQGRRRPPGGAILGPAGTAAATGPRQGGAPTWQSSPDSGYTPGENGREGKPGLPKDGYSSSGGSGSDSDSPGKGRRGRQSSSGSRRRGSLSGNTPGATLLPPPKWYDGSSEQQGKPTEEAVGDGVAMGSRDPAVQQAGQGQPAEAAAQRSQQAEQPQQGQPTRNVCPEAYEMAWDFCTVRGFQDGSLVYKFGARDPGEKLLSQDEPWPRRREGIAWSNALKLGVKRAFILGSFSLRKLDDIIDDYVKQAQHGHSGGSLSSLDHPMHNTWEEVAGYLQQRWADSLRSPEAPERQQLEELEEDEEEDGSAEGAAEQLWQQQQRQEKRDRQQRRKEQRERLQRKEKEKQCATSAVDSLPSAEPGSPSVGGTGLQLDPASSSCWWDFCTVRGLPNGTLVYKFGSTDPAPPYMRPMGYWKAPTAGQAAVGPQQQEAQQQQQGVQEAEQALQQQQQGVQVVEQAMQQQHNSEGEDEGLDGVGLSLDMPPSQDPPSWSHALWLAIKAAAHWQISHAKLGQYAQEYAAQGASKTKLDKWLYRPYDKALVKEQSYLAEQQPQPRQELEATREPGAAAEAQAQQLVPCEVSQLAEQLLPADAAEQFGQRQLAGAAQQAEPQELLAYLSQLPEQKVPAGAAQQQQLPVDVAQQGEQQLPASALRQAQPADLGQEAQLEEALALAPRGCEGRAEPPDEAALERAELGLGEVGQIDGVAFGPSHAAAGEAQLLVEAAHTAPAHADEQQQQQPEPQWQQQPEQEPAGIPTWPSNGAAAAVLAGATVGVAEQPQQQEAKDQAAQRVLEGEAQEARRSASGERWPFAAWLALTAAVARRWWERAVLSLATTLAAAAAATSKALLQLSNSLQPRQQVLTTALVQQQAKVTWPPKVPDAHVSPSLAVMLKDRDAINRQALEACGFDAGGKTTSPLADLPAWRVTQLTGYPVRDLDLYRRAFTHLTALPASQKTAESYERLEWLGDAVLELTIRRLLMNKYPGSDEGELSRITQTLVSGRRCREFGEFLGLDKYIVMAGYGMRDGLQQRSDVLADVFEALVGAIHQDQGLEAAENFVLRVLDSCIDWGELAAAGDSRSVLTKWALSQRMARPRYQIVGREWRPVKETGMLRQYLTVEVSVGGQVAGQGTHWEKCFAEKAAAKAALAAQQT